MAEAIKSSLPFAVDELFSVSTIDVVRSVSADKLKSALQWLVEGVQRVQGEQTVLRQDLAELSQQGSSTPRATLLEPSLTQRQQQVCQLRPWLQPLT